MTDPEWQELLANERPITKLVQLIATGPFTAVGSLMLSICMISIVGRKPGSTPTELKQSLHNTLDAVFDQIFKLHEGIK